MSSRPQRRYSLREVFNALRWLARAGAVWGLLPHDFPPWEMVYQQLRRWNEAGCFEAMVSDMRSIIRTGQGRRGQPSAIIVDGRIATKQLRERATRRLRWLKNVTFLLIN